MPTGDIKGGPARTGRMLYERTAPRRRVWQALAVGADVPDDGQLQRAIDGCELAHRRLRITLGRIDDDAVRGPSRLPGWTVGHLLTHLARNADGHIRILEGAVRGEHLQQYAGGVQGREADIEAGSGRSAQELIDDVVDTFVRLERVWGAMTPDAWDGYGMAGDEVRPCRQLPFFRWREVEVHHVDLGAGYEPADWPEDYVAIELRAALRHLPDRLADSGARAALLGWLTDRAGQPGPLVLSPWLARPVDYSLDA